ncbi:MAG: ATP-dependent DNA helicase UvrD2 [Actinobacteria bacterium]|nr:ATP-dependent DNA helicase UvrD2 [Actinomycetota bacterium]
MDSTALLEGLTARQIEAVITDGAPLAIIAGAGSGKTRVLTRRIAYRVATGDMDPRHVLALTFTRKAAGELRSRLAGLGVRDQVAAGTFHAIAFAQLRRHWADTGKPVPTLLERKVGLLARLAGPSGARGASGPQPIDLAAEIEWAKARCITPDAYEQAVGDIGRRPPLAAGAMASIYERYELEKRRRGLVDFDDLLMACVTALETDGSFAARQRWQFRHLFVDEVQDLNPAQARLLAGWRGTHNDLCVVGDPNQAIYSWNGADPTYLREFPQREAGATVVVLDDNFRSSPQILGVADAVLACGPGAKQASLRPNRPDGPVPTVRSYATDRDEARGIARAVRDAHQPGRPWSNLAVLTRTNAQLVVFEEAFRAADIPYRVRGGGAFLDRPEVQSALVELQHGSGPFDARLTDLAAIARPEVSDDGPLSGAGPAQERQAALVELVRLGHEYRSLDASGTAEGFVAWLTTTLQRNDGTGGPSDVVELSTFHAAKGLEWEVVFLAGLEQGLVPIGHAKQDEEIDEERRLLYVAMTRAEQKLHCSWSAERTFGSRAVPRRPSPWLAEIDAARAALGDGNRPGPDWRAHLAEQRSRLRAADGGAGGTGPARSKRAGGQVPGHAGLNADPDILAALKKWRSTAARAAGVPAYVIFHDTTLAIVAETRPRDRRALLALPGLGPVKAERYGDTLLQLVAEHVA